METCDLCAQPMICGHTLSVDGARRLWRACCLCTAELIARFDRAAQPRS